jgi:hypothetical protein
VKVDTGSEDQDRGGFIMKIEDVPFCTVDWPSLAPSEHAGERGVAFWRTLEIGNIRVRMVEYSLGYKANHWCGRGHVLLVLEGEVCAELKDGRKFTLTPFTSFQVAEDDNAHMISSEKGAKLFIVD